MENDFNNNHINRRIFLIVLDSFGIGYEPDAGLYGDVGSNTLHTIAKSAKFTAPMMLKLGLFNIDGVGELFKEPLPFGIYGRLQEQSIGKDTTVGHWEIAGIISERELPTYPNGFPDEVIEQFKQATGKDILCNLPYSGTDVLRDYGKQHIETGKLIVYTSGDSVFQIAAHEEIVLVENLYEYCRFARKILAGKHEVGRVIARPFRGEYPEFYRTENRHDFSLIPPGPTVLDALEQAGYDTYGIGKISDIFARKGILHTQPTRNNADGMQILLEMQKKSFSGLCFVNLVDFDMLYGHRNDVDGYANAISKFDQFLKGFIEQMQEKDILMITADHGCDPGYPGTDHTREYVPFLAYGKELHQGISLGTRKSFSDIAATIQDIFNIEIITQGKSFKQIILK